MCTQPDVLRKGFHQDPANPVSPSSHGIPTRPHWMGWGWWEEVNLQIWKKRYRWKWTKKQIKKARAEGNLLHERLQKIFQKNKKCKASGQQLCALECRLNCAQSFQGRLVRMSQLVLNKVFLWDAVRHSCCPDSRWGPLAEDGNAKSKRPTYNLR